MATPGILHPMVLLVIGFLYRCAVLSAERGLESTQLPDTQQRCQENQFYCRSQQQCMAEENRMRCPSVDEFRPNGESQSKCSENEKHCLTEEGHKCIPRDQKCECGEGMEYCDSKQHCMHAERMRDPDECPPVCDEGKYYCGFTKTCIRKGNLCKCPKGQLVCATIKGCIDPHKQCPCPKGHTYCNTTWSCLPKSDECPVCPKGKFYCAINGSCLKSEEECGCPGRTSYCAFRANTTVPACLPHGEDGKRCHCKITEKRCLTLLKCIPRESVCPCHEGTEYCEANGECMKNGSCPRHHCPEGQCGPRPSGSPRPGDGIKPSVGHRPGDGIKPSVGHRPGDGIKPSVGHRPGGGIKPSVSHRPGDGMKPSVGHRPGDGMKPSVGHRPGDGMKPSVGHRPGGGIKPSVGHRPGDGMKPSVGHRPGGGIKPSVGHRPGDGMKPSVGHRPGDRMKPSVGHRPGDGMKPSVSHRPGDGTKHSVGHRPGDGTKPSVRPRPGDGTKPSGSPKPEDYIYAGTISARNAEKSYLLSDIVKSPKFSKAIVEGMMNNIGTWQVSKPGRQTRSVDRTSTAWNELTIGLEISRSHKLRFKPSNSTVHGFDGLELKIEGKSKYIAIIVMPCFMPELKILTELSGTEDTPLEFNFNDVFEVTREGSSKSNLVDKYNEYIPDRVLEEYRAALKKPLGENLGVRVFIPAKLGSIDEKGKEKALDVEKERPLTKLSILNRRLPEMKIFSKGSTLVLRPAKDYFGDDDFIKVQPVDVPPGTKRSEDLKSDQCAIGREIQLSIKIENVNDKPSVGRGTLNQPLLNIKAPSLPYELKNDNGGFDIRDVARRVCVDKDRDDLGIAIVEANKTKLGEWQYLDSGAWKSIAFTENEISREAEIIGESAKLIFLTPGQKIRFKPIVKTKLWTAGEGMDYTTARFVCWDQSNKLNSGLHTVSLKDNNATSKKVITVIIQRQGCDGKESSMKRLNECNKCGAKSCRKCDRTMNSTAYINRCGICVLGVTGKRKDHGVNCKGGCSPEFIRVPECGNTCYRRGKKLEDCAGVICGTSRLSRCGKCSKDPKAGLDACGKCNGDNSTCLGCDGVPRSGKVKDYCNKCRSPKSTEFNTGCMSLGRVTPNSCAKGQEQVFQVGASGLPKDGIACEAVFGEIKVEASKIVSKNGKSLQLSLPAMTTSGRYKISCTVDGVKLEAKDNLTFVVYDRETLTVTNVEPDEIDVDSNITEVLVTGTGIVDTGDVYCFFETESNGRVTSSVRNVLNRNQPSLKQIPAERISDTQVKCKVGKKLQSLRVKLSVGFSKNYRIPSSLQLTWLAKAPRIIRHSLNYRLRRIYITFDRSVRRMKNCEELFDQDTMTKLKGFVSKNTAKVVCKFTRSDQLQVRLPRATILKDDIKMKFKTDALKANALFSRSSNPEITIKAPKEKLVPVAIITAPHKLSFSGYGKMSGRNSINTGGKKFNCSWKVHVDDESELSVEAKADLVNIRKKLSKLNSVSACVFYIGYDNLKPGIKYWFMLEVVNFMNETSKIVKRMIERAEGEIPTLKLVTRGTTFHMAKSKFVIRVKAKRSRLIKSKINFLWSCVSDTDLELEDKERNRLILYRNKLECERTYVFNIRAFIATDTRLFSSLNINITTTPAILKTKILRGDRVVAANGVIRLTARTKSRGTCRGKLVHSFSCVDENGYNCVVTGKNGKRELLDFQNETGSTIQLRANQFESNKVYTFTVIVSKGQQEANHSVSITIASGDPPSVEMKTPKINTESSSITARIKTPFNVTYFGWEVVDKSGLGNLDLNDKRISGKLSGTFAKRGKKGRHFFRSVSLVFKKDILEPGVEYQFKLAVLSEQFPDEVGEALVSIKTNAPPHEGNLLVDLSEGVAQNTTFSLKASGFYDDDSPLTYMFYYKKGEGRPRPLGAASEESSIDVTLPSGDANDDNHLLLIVKVTDTYGASSRTETLIKVTPAQITSEDISKAADQAAELASQGDGMESLAVMAMVVDDAKEQGKSEELSSFKEEQTKIMIEVLEENTDPITFRHALPFLINAEPQTDETRKKLASGVTGSVDKSIPTDIIRDSEATSSGEEASAGSRRKRAVEDDTSSEEEEEEEEEEDPGMTIDEMESVLATFESLIDTTVINNVTKDFLQTVDNLLISMCLDLPVGENSLVSSSLAVLKADKNYMDDVDDIFLDVSCANCSSKINHTALIKFGGELKESYNEWNCTGGEELCNGVCAAMVQYPHDFITADNSSTRRSDVVYIGIKNPDTADYISVEGLTSSALVHIPLHDGNLASGKYECSIWDKSNAQWSTSDCVKTQVISQNGAVFVECNCTRLGFITVNALPVTTESASSTQAPTSLTSSSLTSSSLTSSSLTSSSLTSSTQPPTSTNGTYKPSSTETPRLTAEVSFYFDVDYDNIVKDSSTKEQLEDVIEKKLAEVMRVHVSMILNVTISKGSIRVNFIILSPDDKPVNNLNYSITLLQKEINNGEFTVIMSNGVQITADNRSVVFNYKSVSGIQPDSDTNDIKTTEDDGDSSLPLILGCVLGVVFFIVIVLAVVLYQRHLAAKSKVSHENIKSPQPIKNDCVANPAYEGPVGSQPNADVRQTAELPQADGASS